MVAILSKDVASPKHRRVGNGDASEVSTSVSGCTLFGQNHEAIFSTELPRFNVLLIIPSQEPFNLAVTQSYIW
ncbi:uncharacterized protein RAG0_08264 [Rhynchosporium agropyri]|uniref:Uncharacterized protein n=1 Tax=Rhynchosporium agropyri TaxID=914238 RepID=A0A1E1KQ15_9HELO|nr:uncharacterized protein RAG0_08264 [Rhynchosporium agropyri]